MNKKSPNDFTVLMLSPEYPPDYATAVSRYVYHLSQTLTELGVNVIVITCCSDGCMEIDTIKGVKVYRIKRSLFASHPLSMAQQMRQYLPVFIRQVIPYIKGIDVVHANDWKMALAFLEFCKTYDIPLIVSFHNLESAYLQTFSNYLSPIEKYIKKQICEVERVVAKKAKHLILKSEFAYKVITDLFSIKNDIIDIIPYGINLNIINNENISNINAFRSIFATPDQLIVTFINNRNNFISMSYIKALPRIISEYPEVKFIIASPFATGIELWREIKNLNLSSHVFPIGMIGAKVFLSLLKCSDVLVVLDLYESTIFPALEGMMFRLPVIIYQEGIFNESIQNGINSIVIPLMSPESLADKIIHLLIHPKERQKIVDKALKYLIDNHNSVKEAQNTISVYKRLIRYD